MTSPICGGSQQNQSLSPYSADELMCVAQTAEDAEAADDQVTQPDQRSAAVDSFAAIPQMRVNEASAALPILIAAQSGFAQLLTSLRSSLDANQIREIEAEMHLLGQHIRLLQATLANTRSVPEALRATLNNSNWAFPLVPRTTELFQAAVRTPAQIAEYLQTLRQTSAMLGNMTTVLQNTGPVQQTALAAVRLGESALAPQGQAALASARSAAQAVGSRIVDLAGNRISVSAVPQAIRAAVPALEAAAGEVRIVIDEVDDFAPMARAQAAPVVQSLRSAGFSGGPYTRPLLLVAGAAVLIGAAWYWWSDD